MSDHNDLFAQINNAVLDLQGSQIQTFEKPLKTLSRLLHHDDLEMFNKSLLEKADFEKFIADSEKTSGGMAGGHQLVWPDDPEAVLGLTIQLIDKFAADPNHATSFCYHYFYASSNKIMSGFHAATKQVIIPFVRDYKSYIMSSGSKKTKLIRPLSNKIFIVHGHDGESRETVARFLGNIGFEPIILHEQANRGRTIIEKVEANSDVSFAVVLLTPDDEGCAKGGKPEPRARQNVLLELGYFIGLLGRENVCALKRGHLEIPSDFAGVVWETMDGGTGWKQALGRELQAAGHSLDWNKVMR